MYPEGVPSIVDIEDGRSGIAIKFSGAHMLICWDLVQALSSWWTVVTIDRRHSKLEPRWS